MDEKPIRIIIENYKDETIEFVIPQELKVFIMRGRSLVGLTYLDIAVVGNDECLIEEVEGEDYGI